MGSQRLWGGAWGPHSPHSANESASSFLRRRASCRGHIACLCSCVHGLSSHVGARSCTIGLSCARAQPERPSSAKTVVVQRVSGGVGKAIAAHRGRTAMHPPQMK